MIPAAPRMTLAQRAYECYAEGMAWTAHDGSALPRWDEVAEHIRLAWGAFVGAVLAGADLDAAYYRAYMGLLGGPAPSLTNLRSHSPQAAAAWEAAYRRASTGMAG